MEEEDHDTKKKKKKEIIKSTISKRLVQTKFYDNRSFTITLHTQVIYYNRELRGGFKFMEIGCVNFFGWDCFVRAN